MKIGLCIVCLAFMSIVSGDVFGDNPGINKYEAIKKAAVLKKQEFKTAYLETDSREKKDELLDSASSYLFEVLTEKIFPSWYGTEWSFNGITRTPGHGSIACGSFVVHTLQDAGFNISSRMYQQPSENIIKNLTDESNIRRFTNNAPMQKVADWLKLKGHGLYIVGLDIHVGFIIYSSKGMTFCHSSYYDPPLQVVNEEFNSTSPLTDSKYRVLGKIVTKKMIRKWITGEKFELKYDYYRNR